MGCDSVLDFGGRALGKPADVQDARERWRAMRGKDGVLVTGHCVVDTRPGADPDLWRVAMDVNPTMVRFAEVSDEEIDAYLATGEPLHVAGAFTLDGLGGWFVESIVGDPSNVIGLSLPMLRRLLSELDVSVTELWQVAPGAPRLLTGPEPGGADARAPPPVRRAFAAASEPASGDCSGRVSIPSHRVALATKQTICHIKSLRDRAR